LRRLISDQEKSQVWLAFASASVSGLGADGNLTVEDVAEESEELADVMLDAYLSRFDEDYEDLEPEPKPKRRMKR
jgi:hypothetical protein